MKKKSYRKYTYWVKPQDVEEVQGYFRSRDRRLKWARGVVCTPLDIISKVMLVPPKAWEETCDRQGSWYRSSPRAGQYLLVSEEALDHPVMEANTVITPSSFEPPAQAADGDVERLLASGIYRKREPEEWRHMDERERKRWKVMLSKLNVEIDLDRLLLIHSANHANFLEPLLSVQENGTIVPYSIDLSERLCSCCLELYNVLGSKFRKKLVRPCLGALFFARLERDRYYEVVAPGSRDH